jgi:hypothetical protein
VEDGVANYFARKEVSDPQAEVDEETLKKFWPVTADAIAASLQAMWEHLLKTW